VKGHAPQHDLPATLVSSCAVLALRADGAELDHQDDRDRILQDVRAGKHVTLQFDAITYIQRPTPNRNFVRFDDAVLSRLAKSFKGAPFQRDHSTQVGDRGGTVIASELVTTPDGPGFRMTVSLAKPWAVEGVLDGTIDRFSIAWSRRGDVHCSICSASLWDCSHYPGKEYELKDGGKRVCELVYMNAEGTELSAVSVPAVVGTEIEGIRAALEAARASSRGEHMHSFSTLCAILSLSADSPLSAIEGAVSGLSAQLSAEKAAHARTSAALSAAQAALDQAAVDAKKGEIDALVARGIREGRIGLAHDEKGERIPSPEEAGLRALAAIDLKNAEKVLGRWPKITALGAGTQSDALPEKKKAKPTPGAAADDSAAPRASLTKEERRFCKKNGFDPDKYAIEKHKQLSGALAGGDDLDDEDDDADADEVTDTQDTE
jgi:hypothetical protein